MKRIKISDAKKKLYDWIDNHNVQFSISLARRHMGQPYVFVAECKDCNWFEILIISAAEWDGIEKNEK